MFVGLLKHPQSRLESEWHPRVPWPRYSRKLTQFMLTVVARDEDPITPLSSESTLEISLTDENDNPPQFVQATYSFDVVEEALNAVVGTVSATLLFSKLC